METERKTSAWFREQAAAGNFNKKGRLVVPATKGKKVETPEKRGKFGNVKTKDPEGGRAYDSKLEAKHGKEYQKMFKAGEIAALQRQVRFNLGAGITYIADFLIVHLDGSLEVVDSKGVQTPEFKLKKKLFEDKYPMLKLTLRMK